MKNILIIGSLDIMLYIKKFEKKFEINTFKSLSHKCFKYELEKLDKSNINIMNTIIILNNTPENKLEQLILEDTCIEHIFTLKDLKLNNKKIKIYKTINVVKITDILDNTNANPDANLNVNPNVNTNKNANKSVRNLKRDKSSPFEIFMNICLQKKYKFNNLKLPNIPCKSDKQAVYIEFRKLNILKY